MNKNPLHLIQNRPKMALTAIVVLIVAIIVLVIVLAQRGAQSSAPGSLSQDVTSATGTTATGSAGTTASPSAAPSGGTSAKPGTRVPVSPGRTITIDLLSPASGAVWTIGGQNLISWTPAAGVTAEIELVNATTKAVTGVILSQTGMSQTSYTWDARSVSLLRYGGQSKDVVPGVYLIRIHFDGNNLGDLTSGPVYITQ
jgi:hypothetical protein